MPNIAVVADTIACIPADLAKQNNITIVPGANILIDGEAYVENETITAAEAYELIKKDPDRFMTSAINPKHLLDVYQELSKNYQEIVHVTVSGALSANFKTASMAGELLQEQNAVMKVHIVDSKGAGGLEGLVALAVARAVAGGMGMVDLNDYAMKVRDKTKGFFLVDTLRYIYRTGRMSKLGSRVASMFNIRVINKITDEGTVEMVDRSRKREDALNRLFELIRKEATSKDLHFMLNHSIDLETAEMFGHQLKQNFNVLSMVISDYSPVMGYSTGPGALFVAFHPALD